MSDSRWIPVPCDADAFPSTAVDFVALALAITAVLTTEGDLHRDRPVASLPPKQQIQIFPFERILHYNLLMIIAETKF